AFVRCATSRAARPIVCCSRRRCIATATASAPPASAVYRNAPTIGAGPSSDPIAANSFTSPAPVAPNRCPGSINARPRRNPANAPPIDTPLMPVAANTTPASASSAVSVFGTRRVRTSIAAAAAAPAVSVPSTMRSDGLTNVSPEHVVNRLPQRADADDRDDGNERRQQSVLEKVLAVARAAEPSESRHQPLHGISAFQYGEQAAPPCPPQVIALRTTPTARAPTRCV